MEFSVNRLEFPITIYGNFEKVNDTTSKARVRIFYKHGNRNGTYITDEFAEELIKSLPYSPVKGIFEEDDYTDHGQVRSEGRIYGIVPENPNFAWESHLDEDGVERLYACSDVYLFTALYPEAELISGKGQSMELYERTLVYHYAVIEGQKWVVFDHGSFLGLQVLGDQVEPCFEGAAFYNLNDVKDTVKLIEEAISRINSYTVGGKSEMKVLNFKLSDSQKHDFLWSLLNPNYNEEGGWAIDYSVCDIYDAYAITFNYNTGKFERVYYTKDDSTDSIEISSTETVYIVDVTEQEKNTLDTLRALNGGTYELVSENLTNADANAEKCKDFDSKIEELNGTISTLNTEAEEAKTTIANLEGEKADLVNANSTLSEENDALKTYKKNMEDQSKEAVVSEYADKLSQEVLDSYRAKFDEYTLEDLDMRLTYECKKHGTFSFEQEKNPGRLPKDSGRDGVEEILSRYKR